MNTVDKKICTGCNRELSLDNFYNTTRKTQNGLVIVKMPRCKQCKYDEQKKYRENNLEKLQKRDAIYHQKVKDRRRLLEIERLKTPEGKEKLREYRRMYRKKKSEEDPTFKLHQNLRKRIWKCIEKKSKSSKIYLGCTIEEYKDWIEFTMEDGMTWDNYGSVWNIDHVIPISKFDLTKEEEISKAFNWKNTCARNSGENFSKKDKIDEKYLVEQQCLLEKYEKQKNSNI
jgi:hypothetical protein